MRKALFATLAIFASGFWLAACAPSYSPRTPGQSIAELNAKQPKGDVIIGTSYSVGMRIATIGRRIRPAIEDGFRPGEDIILSKGTGPSVYHAGRIEEIGANYRFFRDGSGRVYFEGIDDKEWSIRCETDKITDKRRCFLTNYEAGIFVRYTGQGKPRSACVYQHDFPGRVGALRVDGNKPITTNVEGCISGSNLNRFLAQMRTGSTTVARSVRWPYDFNKDTTANDTPLFRYAEELLSFRHNSLSFSPADVTVQEVATNILN
jgi:hypothetical protein